MIPAYLHTSITFKSSNGGSSLTLLLISLLLVWAVFVVTALLLASTRLSHEAVRYEAPKLRDEALGRGVALLGATAALGTFALAAHVLRASTAMTQIFPILWITSIFPLAIPPIRRADGRLFISSQTLILASVVISILGAFGIAASLLTRLLLSSPTVF